MAKTALQPEQSEESIADKEMRILTAGDTVKIGEEEIQIKPYSWANTFRLAKPFCIIFNVVVTHYNELQKLLSSVQGSKEKVTRLKLITDFIGSINESEDVINALTDLIVYATQMDRSKVETLLLDEFINLCMVVYKVNKDFFVKRLLPMIPKATPQPKK